MKRVNIAQPEFEHDADDPEGFRAGMCRPGPALGAKVTGTSVYELPPGQAVCPYHYEHVEEEWLLVLEGRPSLRDPEGIHELEPWDLVFFETGPDGAHRIQNDTEETARVLMWSPILHPAATTYPDSDKVGLWISKDERVMVRRSSHVDYFDGEV